MGMESTMPRTVITMPWNDCARGRGARIVTLTLHVRATSTLPPTVVTPRESHWPHWVIAV